ncbi:M protein repeat protein [Penicillium alfredii]|uniref:M protein repeat protein n=1 Tax=Penicillium alfredii TaxID=1506179 RepID=A0A9W9F1A0_9EURO|nr:M protein repeat protein [Penicillium alfredii]KAJ5091823.1 M protein repeat protein [Penicillium alfredii]
MAQNSQAAKQKWGMGSFFQQAVAGVESRLDNILMDPDEIATKPASAKATETEKAEASAPAPVPKPPVVSQSRSASGARKNDRLQERLARAVVKSNTNSRVSQSSPSGVSSRASSPAPSNGARSSMDVDSSLAPSTVADNEKNPTTNEEAALSVSASPRASYESGVPPRVSGEFDTAGSIPNTSGETPERPADPEKTNDDLTGSHQNTVAGVSVSEKAPRVNVEPPEQGDDQDPAIARLQADHKAAESQWQEEVYGYIERIDALQSKLQYLAKDAAESAKTAAANAAPGSADKQLLEKDEKIALLLEEGQKLSKTEMDHRTLIKKLRQQLAESTKSQTELKKKTEKLEREAISAEARAQRSEAAEKRANDSLTSQKRVGDDLQAVTKERNALNQTVQDMKAQLSRATARAEAAETKVLSEAAEKERRKASELEEELSNLKIERDIGEEKSKREIKDLKEKMEQERDRARMLETELRNEQSVLESKMESLRARAEEASSGATGESQATLLRQIETLQTQYAVASENWHTLEGSLLSRMANIEKERDEVGRREGEMRKKIRELNLKAKRLEEELEGAKESEQDLEAKLEEHMQDLQKMQQKLQKADDDLTSAQKDLLEQKKVSDATWAQKLEEERARWREQSNFLHGPRGMSPVTSTRRASNLEAAALAMSEFRPPSRRSSTLPPGSPEIGTPPRQNSYPTSVSNAVLSPPQINTSTPSMIMETPSINFEPDEVFSGSGTPATPSAYGGTQAPASRGINDIISESTVGAGPSVQLVERMSATVRRLESERAGSKDELARVTSQRDETRQQVVDLMRELEEKRVSDARVQELETRLVDLDQRYQTTLEMLGERSEKVDELQADVADLKKIYRELVDSTMK